LNIFNYKEIKKTHTAHNGFKDYQKQTQLSS